MMDNSRIGRKEAQGMDEIIARYIKEMKLVSGVNRQRIFAAWDAVSGASAYTVNLYVKNNVLYCGLSSSMVRSQLYYQKDSIVRKINEFLASDDLFVKDSKKDGFIKDIVLK